MLTIAEKQLNEIAQHAEREYPHECCGLLIGTLDREGRKTVLETYPVENAREASARHNRSLIPPLEVLRGERYARERDLDVVGNYHSHPNGEAVPSQFDLDHALPVWSYVIASVIDGKTADRRSWEMENDRSKFNEEKIIEGV